MNLITDDPTYEQLTELQPRLKWLEQQCKYASRLPDREREMEWYKRLKPALSALVGWSSGATGVLESSDAYDTAYRKLYFEVLNGVKL